MPNIPNIQGARYSFDFVAFPKMLFDKKGGPTLIAALIEKKEEVMAKWMNGFYKDVSKGTKQDVKRDIFSPNDFEVFYGKLDEKGTVLLSIKMPDDNCNDIIWIFEYLQDGLTKAGTKLFIDNPRGYALWLKEKTMFQGAGFWEMMMFYYSMYTELCPFYDDTVITECLQTNRLTVTICRLVYKLKN